MMNIKGALGLAKRAINRKVVAITNCYRTAGATTFVTTSFVITTFVTTTETVVLTAP